MRFGLTVQTTVYTSVVAITFACIGSMLLIYNSLHRARHSLLQATEIELPITHAAYEMEINAIETTNGVLAYLDTGQPNLRKAVIKDSNEFNSFNAEYERLATSPVHHKNALSSAALFRQSNIIGQALMALKDQQNSLVDTLVLDLGRNSKMIQQVLMDFSGRVELQKLATLRETERDFSATATSLADYLATRQADHMVHIARISSQGRKALAALVKDINSTVRRKVAGIDVSIEMTIESAHDFMALNRKLHQDIPKFLDLHRQLDNLFDKHIQMQSAKNLNVAAANITQDLDSILSISFVALPLSMILSVLPALMMLKVTRRPIKALKERTAALVAGGLCQRLSVRAGDDFFSLARYFNMILDQLEATTVSKDILEAVNLELRKEIMERNAMQKALGKLSRKIIESQENERRHIARELHDHIGQSLTALKINLESQQGNHPLAQIAPSYADNLCIVADMLTQVRNLSLDLRPPLLDDFGLVPALSWYLDQQVQRGGFTIEFVAPPIEPRPSHNVENSCFRIAQEALTNIIRHAEASHVRVTLGLIDEYITLTVHDNGVGFDVSVARQDAMKGISLGLLGMEERAQLIGGHIQFASASGKGTELRALIPLTFPEETSE